MIEGVRESREKDPMKMCIRCERLKTKITDFYKLQKKYYMSYCKDCCKDKQKEKYLKSLANKIAKTL